VEKGLLRVVVVVVVVAVVVVTYISAT